MNRAPEIPRATYRLQFHRGFNLRDALALVPYLSGLGVSHIYASPLLQALPGSTHGYDVCDFSRLNPELGTEADFAELVAELRRHGMGLVVDIVSNHMGVGGPQNPWWWDLLLRGADSRYAGYFDVEWDWRDPRLRGKVLAPVLGDRYQHVMGRGEIQLGCEAGVFTLRYFDHRFPIATRSLAPLLSTAAARSNSAPLRQLVEHYASTPLTAPTNPGQVGTAPDDESLAQSLDQLGRREPDVAAALAAGLEELNADPDALDALIQQQHYKLAFWRHGDAELNYRRFFNIISLAGLRTELPQVFDDVYALIRQWHERGWVDGLRIDHVDGLSDPEEHLERLRSAVPGAWIVVEKILAHDESLPATWPVAGTTGYDFMVRATGLFVDPAGEQPLTEFYRAFTGETADYPALARAKNRLVLHSVLRAEVNRLLWPLLHVANRHWRVRDFTVDEFREALIEVITCLPVYRTYVRPKTGPVSAADAARVRQALDLAQTERPELDPAVFDFISSLLLLKLHGEVEADFVCRFQQTSGPAMAKGVEDTAFYCFNRLVSLNAVGGDPGRFGVSTKEFHEACRATQEHWPHTMVATSTHDTKRSEDVRARISLLSEIPAEWTAAVRRWSALNERHRRGSFPDRNTEYLIYQTLFGAWPINLPRMQAYMDKAVCEAKVHTSWTRRNERYHAALEAFLNGAMQDAAFTGELEQFLAPLIEPGRVVSLAQTLLKLTAPGVPDIYQGTELWDGSLVDPDNRRPVDYDVRAVIAAEAAGLSAADAWHRWSEGMPKLWLIRRVLHLRREHPDWFGAQSSYQPIEARGPKAAHVVAFMRGERVITLVPRLVLGLREGWGDTELSLPPGTWRNVLKDRPVDPQSCRPSALLDSFPVALLVREETV